MTPCMSINYWSGKDRGTPCSWIRAVCIRVFFSTFLEGLWLIVGLYDLNIWRNSGFDPGTAAHVLHNMFIHASTVFACNILVVLPSLVQRLPRASITSLHLSASWSNSTLFFMIGRGRYWGGGAGGVGPLLHFTLWLSTCLNRGTSQFTLGPRPCII